MLLVKQFKFLLVLFGLPYKWNITKFWLILLVKHNKVLACHQCNITKFWLFLWLKHYKVLACLISETLGSFGLSNQWNTKSFGLSCQWNINSFGLTCKYLTCLISIVACLISIRLSYRNESDDKILMIYFADFVFNQFRQSKY